MVVNELHRVPINKGSLDHSIAVLGNKGFPIKPNHPQDRLSISLGRGGAPEPPTVLTLDGECKLKGIQPGLVIAAAVMEGGTLNNGLIRSHPAPFEVR